MKITATQRVRVRLLRRLGYSQASVSKFLRISLSFVKYWWSRSNLQPESNAGRPKKTSFRKRKQIITKLQSDMGISTHAMASEFAVSAHTIRNIAEEFDITFHHLEKKPILSDAHKAARLAWALAHRNFDWSRAIFTDEKIEYLRPPPHTKNFGVWAPRGAQVPFCRVERHSAKRNISAAISRDHRSVAYCFQQIMNAKVYTEVLAHTIVPMRDWKKKINGRCFWTTIRNTDRSWLSRFSHKTTSKLNFCQPRARI